MATAAAKAPLLELLHGASVQLVADEECTALAK